jgi:hypothetical protein
MSNPFLNYGGGGGDLAALQDGSFDANLATIKDQSLIPNLPLAADASKKVIARLLGVADLVPGTIPANPVVTLTSAGGTSLVNDGTGPALAVKGLTAGAGGILVTSDATTVTVAYNDARLTAVEGDTQNVIGASAGLTTFAGTIEAVTYTSGADPLVATGTYTADSSTVVAEVAGARFTIVAPQTLTAIGVPIIHWPAGNTAITRRFNVWTEAGALVAGYDLPKANIVGQYYTLPVVLPLPAGTYRFAIDRGIGVADVLFAALPGITFDPRVSAVAGCSSTAGYNVFPATLGTVNRVYTGMVFFGIGYGGAVETPTLTGPAGAPVLMASDIDFGDVYDILRVLTINGIKPSGGVYSETPAVTQVGIKPETNLIGLSTGYGSVLVPAGGFQAGDAYKLLVGGSITCSNNDIITLAIKSNFNLPNPSTFITKVVTFDSNQNNGWWELTADFVIRQVGGALTAKIVTTSRLEYNGSSGGTKGLGTNSINTTQFNTLVSNTLAVTYTCSEASVTAFTPNCIVLTRVY